MRNIEFTVPEYITAEDMKNARKNLGLTQQEFAGLLGCSKPTVVRWETGEGRITGPIVLAVYFLLGRESRDSVILPDMKYGLRLLYMYRQNLCTVIDVDENNEKVEIHNYQDNILYRAFGANKNPSFQDYTDFLESRCFPKNRDKMKLELERLNLPFYDPMMIIEKTNGKMAEDDFWIKVERA